MKISREEVIHVADLARLEIREGDIDRFQGQIADILEYVETLRKVDTRGVRPTSHAIFLTNAFREDENREHLDPDTALSNAPQSEDGAFLVPKIIG